jgi:hypothetical protein
VGKGLGLSRLDGREQHRGLGGVEQQARPAAQTITQSVCTGWSAGIVTRRLTGPAASPS